jgi:PAS domain S-box-containing protein
MTEQIPKIILLVEDVIEAAKAQKYLLQSYGYEVVIANTGADAIVMACQSTEIDLILMDIDLGVGLSGPEVAKAILKVRSIPIVFLSSHTEPAIVALTERNTSYGYVVKNSGITVLDASIKMAFKLFEANQRIEHEKEYLRLTLNSIGEGVIATDYNGLITRMNPTAQSLTGWSLIDAKGKPINEIFKIVSALTREPTNIPFHAMCETGDLKQIENGSILIARDGSEHHISNSLALIKAADGSNFGEVLTFRDITEESAVLENLRAHQFELEMQNEQLRAIHEELDASRKRYFEMYDLAPVGCCSVNGNGFIQEPNLTLSNMLGVSRAALINKPFSKFILPADQDEFYRQKKQILEYSEMRIFDIHMLVTNSTPVPVKIHMSLAQDEHSATIIRLIILKG